MSRPTLTTHDRRTRLGVRHRVAPGASASGAVEASAAMAGLHATDPVTTFLSAWARVPDLARADVERALYADRTLLKILGMRRTMFVLPRELAAVVHSACAASIARGERKRFARMLREGGVTSDPEQWIAEVEARTLDALHGLGEATATELTKVVPELGTQIAFGEGSRWQGTVGVSTRLLFLLAGEGRIIRGRPRGTIVSSLYRWVPMDRWVPGGLREIPTEVAQAELVRHYLRTFGPATRRDVAWWTGWTVAEVRGALTAIGAVEVDLDDGATGYVLPDDLQAPPDAGEPWVALLPALDPTVMGWKDRAWYLGPHAERVFDTNGNAGPTVWLDGRIVGGWVQRRDGTIAVRLLEDVGDDAARRITGKAHELEAWLGDLRFTPRFRTPLEVELGAWPPQAGAALEGTRAMLRR